MKQENFDKRYIWN